MQFHWEIGFSLVSQRGGGLYRMLVNFDQALWYFKGVESVLFIYNIICEKLAVINFFWTSFLLIHLAPSGGYEFKISLQAKTWKSS